MKRKRNYDKKVRLTRILLADYLLLKELSQRAGVSMAEALHKILTKQIKPEPVTEPAYRALPAQAYRAVPAQAYGAEILAAYGYLGSAAIATNGSKLPAFRIKPKGVRYD
ncbi:unnamed protein product [marine sediment metagenome]|uniref:Uncharacterized protein n=1 Tax=marine sediment metagenome TaxID=412755 RepID=X1MTX2_9ZZZZ